MAGPILHMGWTGADTSVRVLSGGRLVSADQGRLQISLDGDAPARLQVDDIRHLQRAQIDPAPVSQDPLRPLALVTALGNSAPSHAILSDGRIRSAGRLLDGMTGFLPETRLATSDGARSADSLRPGDSLLTRDAGFQPILWVGRIRIIAADAYGGLLSADTVRVRPGGLGPGQPSNPIDLPPGHRALLAENTAALHFEEREVLVAARDLPFLERGATGPALETDLVQVLLPDHQVVLAEGAWCETLQATPERLCLFAPDARREVLSLIRDRDGASSDAARLMLTLSEAALLRSAL